MRSPISARLALPIIGALLVTGAAPVLAAPFELPPPHGDIRLAADSSFESKKDEYLAKAREQMKAWQDKLEVYGKKAEIDTRDTRAKASADLKDAWAKTKVASDHLATATEEGWEKAKRAFEQTSQELSERWHRTTADKG